MRTANSFLSKRVVRFLFAALLLEAVAVSAQPFDITPGVLEILTTHPAFKSFPRSRVSYVATTVKSSYGSTTTSVTSRSTLPSGLVEIRSESRDSASWGSTMSLNRGVEFGPLWITYRGSSSTRRAKEEEEMEARHDVVALRDIEGSLFPIREGARLAFNQDIVRHTQSRLVGGAVREPSTSRETMSIAIVVERRIEPGSVLTDLPGAAWEVSLTATHSNQYGQGKHVSYAAFLQDLGAFVPMRGETTFTPKTGKKPNTGSYQHAIEEIRWRDDSLREHRVSRTGGATVAASASTAPQTTADDRARAHKLFAQAFRLFQSGDFEAAAIQFRDGLALEPDSAHGHFFLAETYMRLDRRIPAREHYERAVFLAPDSPEGAKAQAALTRLR
jgi:hypothetical protein